MEKRFFGELPGLEVGDKFSSRVELSLSNIHKPRQAGISGSQIEGCDSIIVSGGYEDDEDLGDTIIYTGHGGRDLSSGKQVANQELVRGNLALAINCRTGLPVRVIRGAHKNSIHAPELGYRYDGLYRVEDYWKEKGKNGFIVWRYRLTKIPKSPIPDHFAGEKENHKKTKRNETIVQRIVRDTNLSLSIKKLYNYQCQVCGTEIMTSSGPYAEAAHIKPLGAPHDGPDIFPNLLCLCPNHHVMFDFGGFSILPNFKLIGIEGQLNVHPKHQIELEFIEYHLEHFYDEKNR